MTTYEKELHDEMKLADKVYRSIIFEYEESDNQDDLFSPMHTRFDCTITRGDKSFTFDYQCNTLYTEPEKSGCIECLLMDADAGDYELEDFLEEFGYLTSGKSALDGIKAHKACKRTAKGLKKLFTNEELSALNAWYSMQ